MKGTRAWVGRFVTEAGLGAMLGEALDWLGAGRLVRGARVFVKPNLTWKFPTPGVTTSPGFIEAVVARLTDWTSRITVGEADGGYHAFKAEDAFVAHGLDELRDRFGAAVVNLSEVEAGRFVARVEGREVAVDLPRFLVEDIDVFVTLPVPKVHAMTGISLGFKNQWGCQPGTMRLRNHPDFTRKLLAINRLLRPRLALFDGTYFLDKTGPMIGEPVRMDLLIGADDVGAGDLTCCEIMGIDVRRVKYLHAARQEGMMPLSLEQVAINRPVEPFKSRRFTLRRSPINYIALAAFHSRLGTRLIYDSPLADPIHRVLYAVRKNRLIGWLLYGPGGPPATEGKRS